MTVTAGSVELLAELTELVALSGDPNVSAAGLGIRIRNQRQLYADMKQALRLAWQTADEVREDIARIKVQRDNALLDMERFMNEASGAREALTSKIGNGIPPALPKGWTQEHAALASWMINTLAVTPTAEWRSKAEIYGSLAVFRSLSTTGAPKP